MMRASTLRGLTGLAASILPVLLPGGVAPAAQKSIGVPFKDGQFLDVMLSWDRNPPSPEENPRELRVPVGYRKSAEDSMRPLESWQFGKAALPLASFTVHAKVWVILGELVTNPGIVWSYRDSFYVEDRAGASFKIDRAAFAKYPDLARRLRAARISVERVEVDAVGVQKGERNVDLTFLFTANDFIIPAEGAKPLMVPGSPARWADRLQTENGRGDRSDAALRGLWSKLAAVESARVRLTGLRIPEDELAGIAKDFKQREDKGKALEKEYAALDPGFVPSAVKPYPEGLPASLPFEDPAAEVFRDDKRGVVGIKARDSVLVEFETKDDYRELRSLAGSKFFALVGSKGEAIVNRRGERQRIDGEDVFDSVKVVSGTLVVTRVLSRGERIEGAWNSSLGERARSRLYGSENEAAQVIRDQVERVQRQRQEEWERLTKAEKASSEGGISLGLVPNYHIYEVSRSTLDLMLKVLASAHGYEIR